MLNDLRKLLWYAIGKTEDACKKFIHILLLFILAVSFPLTAFAQDDVLVRIDDFIRSQIKSNHLPSLAIAVTHGERVLFAQGYGLLSDGTLVTADTLFPIASLSKSFTALAVMQLAENNQLDIDDPVNAYLPDFELRDRDAERITIRHLLNQTSGLNDINNPDMTRKPQIQKLEETTARLSGIELSVGAGEKYAYHNPNYQILAYLVQTVSGLPFSEYLRLNIFEPLGMNGSYSVYHTSDFLNDPGIADGHFFLFGRPVRAEEPEWFIGGSAGIISSANDMAKWMIAQQDGQYQNVRLLDAQGIREMQSRASEKSPYGLGWNVYLGDGGEKIVSHGGIFWTYKSEERLLADEDYGIVLLAGSGLNPFVNYYGLIDGVDRLLHGKSPNSAFFSNQIYEILITFAVLLVVFRAVYKIRHLERWLEKYAKAPVTRLLTSIVIPLALCGLVLFLPRIMAPLAGGRLVPWSSLLLMMPSVMLLLCTMAATGVILMIAKLVRIARCKNGSGVF